MSRLRSLLWLVLVIVGPAMLAAEGRYWVALQLRPDQDLAAIANQVASTVRGRIESIDEGAGAFVLVTTDAAVGTMKTLPGVASVQTADDPYGAPRRPALAAPNGTTTWTTGTYAYDGSGNIKSITRAGQTDEFVYDAFGRLTSGTAGASQKQEYTYDSFGNILTKKTNGTTVTYGVDAATSRVVLTGAQYDAAGRLTARPVGDSFTYDGLDVVTQSTVDSVSKVYLYNASDERVASFTVQNGLAAAVEWMIRTPEGKVLRRFSTGQDGALTWREDYIYRGAQLLASEVNGGEKRRFFHLDHLGTPRLITGNGGVQVSAHTYFPFGEEVTPAGTEALKFTGHERDAASLDYMHARYYATTWGRFLSVDPVIDAEIAVHEPQLWNRYAYVTNNPLEYVDDDGRERLISRSALPSAENGRQNATATLEFVRGATHYNDIREALSGNWEGASAGEKWMAAAVVGISLLDLGSTLLAPEEKGGIAGGEAVAFRSFNAFKNRFGAAGAGMEWHHVVEQTAGNAAKFGPEALHNSVNLVRLDTSSHRAISAYYSSKQGFTGGLTVRQWLASKSFKEQYEFGQRMLKIFSSIPR